MKNFKPRIKARLRKSKIDIKKKLTVVTEKAKIVKNKTDLKTNIKNFFDWVKGAELVELEKCNMDVERITIYVNLIRESLKKFNEYTLSVELSKSEFEHLKSLFNIEDAGFENTYTFTKKTQVD